MNIRLLFLTLISYLFLYAVTVKAEVLFSDGFETGDLTHTDASGAAWGGAVNTGVTNEIAHTGDYCLKFSYPGNIDTNKDSWSEQRFVLSTAEQQEVYIRYYIYFDSSYVIRDVGPANNKFIYIWGDSYQNDMNKVGIEIEKTMMAGFKTKIAGVWPDLVPSCSGSTGYIRNIPRFTLSEGNIGKWLCFEIHYKLDDGSSNGILQWWVDDELIIDVHNLSWDGAPCGENQFLRNGYLMGWSNAGFDEDAFVYIDDVIFFTKVPEGLEVGP